MCKDFPPRCSSRTMHFSMPGTRDTTKASISRSMMANASIRLLFVSGTWYFGMMPFKRQLSVIYLGTNMHFEGAPSFPMHIKFVPNDDWMAFHNQLQIKLFFLSKIPLIWSSRPLSDQTPTRQVPAGPALFPLLPPPILCPPMSVPLHCLASPLQLAPVPQYCLLCPPPQCLLRHDPVKLDKKKIIW